ncbi:MAG: hypothetical protein KGI54_14195 [Pseudomonadota bacterium]|nr:hypothetical protein [Pseudomonadota bacterium]
MPNMRESVTAALNSSLDSDEMHERPIDRLGAFSKSKRLGTVLWRLKYDNDPRCYKTAIFLLTKAMRKHGESRELCEKLCQCALDEWLVDKCLHCGGGGQVIFSQRLVNCMECSGTGIRRTSDKDRMKALKMNAEQVQKLGKRLGAIHDLIGEWDRKVNVRTMIELER